MAPDPLRQPLERLPSVLAVPVARVRRSGAVFDVRPPGSKSLTNRALLLGALASGESTISNALIDGDDTRRMIEALRVLGAEIRSDPREPTVVRVWGLAGKPRSGTGGGGGGGDGGARLNLGNAGTATRFLTAAAALADGPVTLDGNERMRQRPIGELGEALAQLGCGVEYLEAPGSPPLRITPAPRAHAPDRTVQLGETASSQFVSALLMAGVFMPGGLTVKVTGEVTSPSYIRMTMWLLARLGAVVQSSDDLRVVRVRGVGKDVCGLASFKYEVEPDASGATYFLGAAALLPGVTCRVLGLSHTSVQGDAKFASLLARMGAVTQHETSGNGGPRSDAFIGVTGAGAIEPILADMSDMPDAAMTLAAVACFANGTSILRGLRTLRVKETDRIEAMRKELTKLGVRIENPVSGDDGAMTITPPEGGIDCSANAPRVEFDTYDDHRMAMSLSLIALRRPNTLIRNPRCVEKTYPAYWRDLADLCDTVGSG